MGGDNGGAVEGLVRGRKKAVLQGEDRKIRNTDKNFRLSFVKFSCVLTTSL